MDHVSPPPAIVAGARIPITVQLLRDAMMIQGKILNYLYKSILFINMHYISSTTLLHHVKNISQSWLLFGCLYRDLVS